MSALQEMLLELDTIFSKFLLEDCMLKVIYIQNPCEIWSSMSALQEMLLELDQTDRNRLV